MPYEPPPELAGLTLDQIAEQAATRKLPPLDQWSPVRTGDSEMHIARDGRWFHQGGEITRPAMIRAFSGLLLRDETGEHWLVTPFEKLSIAVEDSAFIATDIEQRTNEDGLPVLAFRLNTDEVVLCGPDHPLRVAGSPDVPAYYLAVRHGTEARLNRSTYGQLIELALASGEEHLVIHSQGTVFPLVPSA